MSEYTEGVCGDGAAILRDGQAMTIGEIVAALNSHDALVEAKQTISECLQDTAFRNGVMAGWNAALIKDDAEAQKMYEQLAVDKDDRLKTLKAARAEVDRLIANESAADCKGEG